MAKAANEQVTLGSFIEKYKTQISDEINKKLNPIYDPSNPEPEYDAKIAELLRPPFPVQGEVVKAVAKTVYKKGVNNVFVVGEMGTGKCQHPDTIVTVNNLNMTIEDAFDSFSRKETECFDGEGCWFEVKPAKTPSYNEDGKIRQNTILHFYKQYVKEKIRKVFVSNGSIVTTTFSHKFLKPSGWDNEINKGDYVAVPKEEEYIGEKQHIINPELFGWMIGEGTFRLSNTVTRVGSLYIHQKDESVLKHLSKLLSEIPFDDIKPSIKKYGTCSNLRVNSRKLIALLENNGYMWGLRSKEQYIPHFLMNSTKDDIKSFLKAYFDADGFVSNSKRGIVQYTTASWVLANQVITLLRRLGIYSTISEGLKSATNTKNKTKRTYYTISIGGSDARKFAEIIGSSIKFKQDRFTELLQRPVNNNLNTVYVYDLIKDFKLNTGLGRKVTDGLLSNVYVNGSEQSMNKEKAIQLLSLMDSVIDGSLFIKFKSNVNKIGGGNYTQLINKLSLCDISKVSEQREILQKRIDSHVIFNKVVRVEEFHYEGWVYDMEIKDTHNFIGNNVLLHNTMIGLSALFMSPKPCRAILLCPTHLVSKWQREAEATIPGVKVVDLSVPGAISILDKHRGKKKQPQTHEIWLLSKEKAKLSYGWKPAAVKIQGSESPHCPDCSSIAMTEEDGKYVSWEVLSKKRYKCVKCKTPLYQAAKPMRFGIADFIRRYLRNFFEIAIIDEVHDYKAGDSLQGFAMGAIIQATKKCFCLTGTLNGGYADDLFYLLFRMEPKRMKADGFDHSSAMKWLQAFGTLESVKKIESEEHSYGKSKRKQEIVRRRPGVSPLVVGKYLLDKSVFIRLNDVIEGLPPYEENVVSIDMDQQDSKYKLLEDKLREVVRKFKNKASGALLQALLSYPDSCSSYEEKIEIKDKDSGEVLATVEAPKITLSEGELLPKEKELVKMAVEERDNGRKLLCYLSFTGSRDIRLRLKEILMSHGLRVGVLNVTVEPKKREAWIKKNSPDMDVLLVNSELVKTGLDLYEFPTIVFYQTGYNIFTIRQAARRSWRIGQTEPVRVFFFCYKDTMQETAMSLTARKLEAAMLVEGDLPEGLADYADESGGMLEELSKALISGETFSGAEKVWASFRKKEIESQLGIGSKESIFTEVSEKKVKKLPPAEKTTITDNVMVKVTLKSGKGKSSSTIEVQYGELEKVSAGKAIQFAMF